MVSSAPATEPLARGSSLDWEELSGLDRIVAAYQVGENSLVVETNDGREIRITAWRDLSNGKCFAEYERRGVLRSGGLELQVWTHTPAYKRCQADDVTSCLEAAVLEVDRVNVY